MAMRGDGASSPKGFDSDSEEENDPKYEEFVWKRGTTVPDAIDTFVIMEYDAAVYFAEKCLITKENEIDRIENADIVLYTTIKEDIIICTSLNKSVYLHKTGEIVSLLHRWFKNSKRIVGMQTLPSACYRTSERKQPDTLRVLTTSSEKPKTPRLEIPNIISGVSAGAINFCDYYGTDASIYVYYLESILYGLDETRATNVITILNSYGIPILRKFERKKIYSSAYS